jgi:hypothetical protein
VSTLRTAIGLGVCLGGFIAACSTSAGEEPSFDGGLDHDATTPDGSRPDGSGAGEGASDVAPPFDAGVSDVTPSLADNPPVPVGWQLIMQSQVTPDMTAWATMILDDPVTYPMFSTATKAFGSTTVMARVEWHPPDFQNGVIHRGVTLYVPYVPG